MSDTVRSTVPLYDEMKKTVQDAENGLELAPRRRAQPMRLSDESLLVPSNSKRAKMATRLVLQDRPVQSKSKMGGARLNKKPASDQTKAQDANVQVRQVAFLSTSVSETTSLKSVFDGYRKAEVDVSPELDTTDNPSETYDVLRALAEQRCNSCTMCQKPDCGLCAACVRNKAVTSPFRFGCLLKVRKRDEAC